MRACHSAHVFVLFTWRSHHENLQGEKTPPVVTMFHNLYDNVTRDVFVTRLNWLGLPIELPVFSGEREALPDELVKFLLRGKTIIRRKTMRALGSKVCRAADSPGCHKAGSCCCHLALSTLRCTVFSRCRASCRLPDPSQEGTQGFRLLARQLYLQ